MRFEGCGNSLDWLQRLKFDSSVWAHSVRKDFMVTHVQNNGFLAVSAHNSNWIWKLPVHLLQAYNCGVRESCKVVQVLVYLASDGYYGSATLFGHPIFGEDSGKHWIFKTRQFHSQSRWPRGLTSRPKAARLLGLRASIPRGTWLPASCVVYCEVEVSASGRSLAQRSPTECVLS
jgi:hypothetical protein